MKIALSNVALFVGLATAAFADDDLRGKPAFSLGDQPAERFAQCREVREMSKGLDRATSRIDLSLIAELTSVSSNGALWYLTACNLPDVRIMCVTYERNEMKVGERVYIKGGYRRVDDNHALLDPCLANREGQ